MQLNGHFDTWTYFRRVGKDNAPQRPFGCTIWRFDLGHCVIRQRRGPSCLKDATSISLGQKTNFHLGVSHRKHN